MKTIMKTIYKSVLITILSSLILVCIFTVLGLLLNFWNESIGNAALALMASLLIGSISFAGLSVLVAEKGNLR
jgi:hypothetical protein|tara:strand:+ start:412 stop:630 length:219 start_codon:yes stop_codon:yes gene_type:complete